MDPIDAARLIDYVYWCRDQVLVATVKVPAVALISSTPVTFRDLLGTLVHELDVELSWRWRRPQPMKSPAPTHCPTSCSTW